MHKKTWPPGVSFTNKFAIEKLESAEDLPTFSLAERNFRWATIGKFAMCYMSLKGQYHEIFYWLNGLRKLTEFYNSCTLLRESESIIETFPSLKQNLRQGCLKIWYSVLIFLVLAVLIVFCLKKTPRKIRELHYNKEKKFSKLVKITFHYFTLQATRWGQSLPKPRGGEILRSRVTTSTCLMKPCTIHYF
jgi:hypothetical protein